LSVTGRGEVLVDPDQAVIQVGVRAEEVSAKAAQQEVNKTVQKVLDGLSALAIEPDEIQTSQLSLQAVYADSRNRREAGEPRIIAYRASYTLSIKTKDLGQISTVIDSALEAGANQLSGVRFGLEDRQSTRKSALKKAVADAREKAVVIAEAAGTRLGSILTIVEAGAVVRPVVMGRSAVMAAEVSGSPTVVMPGQVTVSGQVTIRYQISEE